MPIKACQIFQVGSQMSASAIDYYQDSFSSIRNLFCQLNSLQTVTSMWRGSGRSYEAVVYLRPDMLYNCPLPAERIKRLEENTIYLANFHHWRGYNDRFAMGTPHVAGTWGDRYDDTLSACMQHSAWNPSRALPFFATHLSVSGVSVDDASWKVHAHVI
jgi:hypothetical protein